MKTFELRLIPYDLHTAIKAAAFREGVSMNTLILTVLKEKFMAWPKCKDCNGTGLNPKCNEDACYFCGGRGFILPKNKAQQRASEESEKGVED